MRFEICAARRSSWSRIRARAGAWVAGSLLLWLAGCAAPGPVPVEPVPREDAALVRCAELFRAVERAVAKAGVRDDQAHVVEGHPWLRVNRWLASFRGVDQPGAVDQWLSLMAGLDEEGRRFEIRNLPESARTALGDGVPGRLEGCRERLVNHDAGSPERLAAIRERATVPDAYQAWKRVAGIYPIAGWFVLQGVADWQREVRETFRHEPDPEAYEFLSPGGDAGGADTRTILRRASDNPLAAPLPDRRNAQRLLRRFAPVFAIEIRGDWDRPGVPVWRGDVPGVRPEPVVYGRLSRTRLFRHSLLQLNYLVWFDRRPARGSFDYLAGRLDGVFWRVTLGPDGEPLLYDSMHACGCYHMAFPTPRLEPVEVEGFLQESLLVPRRAPGGDGRMVVYLESGTHYVVGVERAPGRRQGATYRLRPYDELRSISDGSEQRSLFGSHGIVPGTHRAERWFLWPTGVRSPGAMRQWGRHATAFAGRRHFDDARLIERYFRVRDIEDSP